MIVNIKKTHRLRDSPLTRLVHEPELKLWNFSRRFFTILLSVFLLPRRAAGLLDTLCGLSPKLPSFPVVASSCSPTVLPSPASRLPGTRSMTMTLLCCIVGSAAGLFLTGSWRFCTSWRGSSVATGMLSRELHLHSWRHACGGRPSSAAGLHCSTPGWLSAESQGR